jgi:hypothetical protein
MQTEQSINAEAQQLYWEAGAWAAFPATHDALAIAIASRGSNAQQKPLMHCTTAFHEHNRPNTPLLAVSLIFQASTLSWLSKVVVNANSTACDCSQVHSMPARQQQAQPQCHFCW